MAYKCLAIYKTFLKSAGRYFTTQVFYNFALLAHFTVN